MDAPARVRARTAVLQGHLRALPLPSHPEEQHQPPPAALLDEEAQRSPEGAPEARSATSVCLRWTRADAGDSDSGAAPRSKLTTAAEAAALVPDGATVTIGGFVGSGCPEALLNAVRARFDETGKPQGLQLAFGISVGDKKGRGTDVLAKEGLVKSLMYAWTGTAPKLLKLVNEQKVTAWNFPLGAMSHLFRDIASSKPGPITRVGLGTFVDPRHKGGKLNAVTTEDRVELVTLGGREYLWYKAFPVHVALLRGTTADESGNISMEHEPLYLDVLNQAMAAKNSGGVVIVQVARMAKALPARAVHIPGVMVDHVVVSPPATHLMNFTLPAYDPSLTGELQRPMTALTPLPPGEKRILAHRAMFELKEPSTFMNLGVGTPEGVSVMAVTHSHQNPHARSATLSTEAGSVGGTPGGGGLFGAAYNPTCTLPAASMLDFYQGGSIGVTCLGCAEVDSQGNVNVSNFGVGRMPGCGGFIDISQTAKKVIFMGTLTNGGLKTRVANGKLVIEREGKAKKFVRAVNETTFAASSAGGRPILYLTERCVFSLTPKGLLLVEVAPGIDVERDVVANMEFRPLIPPGGPVLMDARIFEA